MSEIEQNTDNELAGLRARLDWVDNTIFLLLAERFRITSEVGIYKAKNGIPPVDKQREAAQFERVGRLAEEAGLSPEFAQKILRTIIDEVVENHIAIQKDYEE